MFPYRPDPETGSAHRQARDSLFGLLVVTVVLGTVLNALISQLWDPKTDNLLWWIGLLVMVIAGVVLVYWGIWCDDQRIGEMDARVELLLPYMESRRGRVTLGIRSSYGVTKRAREAWRVRFGKSGFEPAKESEHFTKRIEDEHMDLVHYLLARDVFDFGEFAAPDQSIHSWLRLDIPMAEVPWAQTPAVIQANPFFENVTHPKAISIPEGATLEVSKEGDGVLLRLKWQPPRRRWHHRLLSMGRRPPGGEVRVRWLGPLSEVKRHDKRYEHLTARLPEDRLPSTRVVATRLVVEVETRLNMLNEVARFRDWAINLAYHLKRRVDYQAWWDYYLARQIADLDWKIGYIKKQDPEDLSLAERLRRMDERMAALEAHLQTGEAPEDRDDRDGVWLSDGE